MSVNHEAKGSGAAVEGTNENRQHRKEEGGGRPRRRNRRRNRGKGQKPEAKTASNVAAQTPKHNRDNNAPARPKPVDARPTSDTQAPRRSERPMVNRSVYSAIDLGTNNCRLLIARPTKGGFRVIDAFSASCALAKVWRTATASLMLPWTARLRHLKYAQTKLPGGM